MAKPFNRILLVDAETRWDSKEYTLSKLTTEEYVRDPRFKAFGFCFKWYGEENEIQWVSHKDLPAYLNKIDWASTAVMAHNAMFDVAILAWIYGHKPAFIIDTLSMARALRGATGGNGLAKLAEDFVLPPKGRAVHSTDGLAELTPEIEEEIAEYCKHDVFLLEKVYDRLNELAGPSGFPTKELRIIDMVVKMYINPQLELDTAMLRKAIDDEEVKRKELLVSLGVEEKDLASNDKFADLLRLLGVSPPTKISKTTGKEAFAFAKTDAMFQALENHDNEKVALLCEARVAVKSTQARTRAQRFFDISMRGALPVPLYYYAAHTGRIQAAKGQGINLQNLKRGSFLRNAIMAPIGYRVVVVDLSQIEPRVLAWLADYEYLLDIFRAGGDPYAMFGAQMFGIPGLNKNEHGALRQSAKSALLGCFGPDTPVLTNRGWVPIVNVQATDLVWDGSDWVCHQGVLPQGEKEVLTALGISATSDHEILTGHGWQEWSAVLTSPSHFLSALSSASLPVSRGHGVLTAPNGKASLGISPGCAVPAAGPGSLTEETCAPGVLRAAALAQKRNRRRRGWIAQVTNRFARTAPTEIDCSTESARALFDARTPQAASTPTMVGAVLRYTHRGWLTGTSSCATSLGWTDGIFRRCSLIASTTSAAMSRAISVSARAASTWLTSGASPRGVSKNSSGASQPLKQRMQTYDIAYAGPRNRYTVLTDAGPIVVHNCGFGMGWASFAAQLLVGFMGAPPVRYDKKFAKQLGITGADVAQFISWEPNVERALAIPRTCTDEEVIMHSVCAKRIIERYRDAASPVVDLWNLCDELLLASLYGGKEYTHKFLKFAKERIVLPSGMALRYPEIGFEIDAKQRRQWYYGPDKKKLYGAKLVENFVQAVARCVMTDGMLRIQNRYPCVLTVHDEAVALVPTSEVVEAEKWIFAQMVKPPSYMPDIPLAADSGAGARYGEAK